MNNYEATAYARIALLNLIEPNADINTDNLLYEMHSLFDEFDNDAIIKEAYFRL